MPASRQLPSQARKHSIMQRPYFLVSTSLRACSIFAKASTLALSNVRWLVIAAFKFLMLPDLLSLLLATTHSIGSATVQGNHGFLLVQLLVEQPPSMGIFG